MRGGTTSAICLPQKIEQRIEKNPDNIHKVPVQANDLDRRRVRGGENTAPGEHCQDSQQTKANNHMQGMQTRHEKIEDQEELHLTRIRSVIAKPDPWYQAVVIFMPVLVALDTQKRQTQEHSQQQEAYQELPT